MQILNLYYPLGVSNIKYNNNRPMNVARTVQFCGQNYRNIKIGNNVVNTRFFVLKSFYRVDDYVYRGGKPSEAHIKLLKKLGIGTIIDFTDRCASSGNINAEEQIAKRLGMNYINLPFLPFKNPTEEQIKEFFEIVENARKNNEMVYIHCTRGRDRTGFFASLYKLKYNLTESFDSCIGEMLALGHHPGYSAHIDYLRNFYHSLRLLA